MKHYLQNSLRALFLSLSVLLSLPMMAAVKVEIDGINYELIPKGKVATVIAKSSSGGKYFGDIVIPESIEYNGTNYSVTSIGDYAFDNCSGLTSVVIPNSTTSIGERAFYQCSRLTSVTIGNSVISIGDYAFFLCYWLKSVHISDLAAWCKVDFASDESNPLYYAHHLFLNGQEVKDLIIPNSVTSIGSRVFEGCFSLTSVTIPNNVTSIGSRAFDGCRRLISVSISNCVIGNGAFSYCDELTSIVIGNGTASCPVWHATRIESGAFEFCPELLDVYCYAEEVPPGRSDAFNGSYPEHVTLHVPAGSIEEYKRLTPWSRFGKIVALTEEETGIDKLKSGNGTVEPMFFDLNGRRVQKVQKGLYIQNGRKVLIK